MGSHWNLSRYSQLSCPKLCSMTRMIFSPKNTWEYFEKPPCPLEGGPSGAMRVETKDAAQHWTEHRTVSPTNAQHKQKEKGPQEIPY